MKPTVTEEHSRANQRYDERELLRRNREITALYEIGRQISASFDVAEVLELIAKNISWLFECQFAGVALIDKSSGTIGWTAVAGGSSGPSAPIPLGAAGGLIGDVIETLRPASIFQKDRVDAGPFLAHAAGNVTSAVAVPLLREKELVGILAAASREALRFTDDDISLLVNLAHHAALVIDNARLYQSTLDYARKLKALSSRLTVAQEEERRRIARELHDGVGQSLIALRLNIELLAKEEPVTSARSLERVDFLKSLIDETLKDLRAMAFELRPTVLDDFGLAAALQIHLERFRKTTAIDITLSCDPDLGRSPNQVEATIYRVIQEALSNIARHAGAARGRVLLERRDGLLILEVSDNGCGWSESKNSRQGYPAEGLGIINMKERVSELSGTFSITSHPGEGTVVHVEIPTP